MGIRAWAVLIRHQTRAASPRDLVGWPSGHPERARRDMKAFISAVRCTKTLANGDREAGDHPLQLRVRLFHDRDARAGFRQDGECLFTRLPTQQQDADRREAQYDAEGGYEQKALFCSATGDNAYQQEIESSMSRACRSYGIELRVTLTLNAYECSAFWSE